MRAFLKFIAIAVAGIVGLLLVVGIAITLLFDPNDYKDDIEKAVRDATGREFTVEGDLEFSLFPWLALEVGRTTLGNAEGFGDEPFFQVEGASLSVKILPLILSDELAIGTASLDSLRVNLAVDSTGRSNWDDLVERQELADERPEAAEPDEPDTGPSISAEKSFSVDVASIAVSDAAFSYRDDQAGTMYRIDNANLETGRITVGTPVPVRGGFRFAAEPDAIGGQVDLDVTITLDPETGAVTLAGLELDTRIEGATEAPADIRLKAPLIAVNTEQQTVAPGDLELSVFDLDLAASVEPFSYAGEPEPTATISIAPFSPRSLLTTLGAELPATADPAALELLSLDATAAVTAEHIAMTGIVLVVDSTTFRGELSVPRTDGGSYELDLEGDTIDLNRYMAPAEDTAPASDEAAPPAEIPTELLRAFNARGSLALDEALMGRILFEDVELVLNLRDGRLRMHPIGAKLFDGQYQGDVRVDASGSTPVLSVNERIENVSLAPLGVAMFERRELSGLVNGVFTLTGQGGDMAAIQQTLNGDVAFELRDGAWEGVDVWYELRRARALVRQEAPPEPVTPARTRFSEVSATGKVVDGVLNNDDFRAELPFMQLTGSGTVDLVEATVDYGLRARILDKPELMGDVTDSEMSDFTRTVLPVKISGSLAAPKFGLDLEAVVKERAEEEVRDRLLDLLGGDEADAEGDTAAEGEQAPAEEEKDPEDILKDRLRDLIKKRD